MLTWYRQQGAGYQTRMNAVLSEVRGRGLWIAFELVDDTGAPDAPRAARISKLLRESCVVMGGGGYSGNVLKIAPPLVIDENDLKEGLHKIVEAMRAG